MFFHPGFEISIINIFKTNSEGYLFKKYLQKFLQKKKNTVTKSGKYLKTALNK